MMRKLFGGFDLRLWVVILLLIAPLLAGAWYVFPITDDSWMALFVKERGLGVVPNAVHRTLAAQIWDWCFTSMERARWIGLSGLVVLWALYSWLTAVLWTRLFPEKSDWRVLPAALVLIPAVSSTHLTTTMVLLPVQLPALLTLFGLLLLWNTGSLGERIPPIAMSLFSVLLIFSFVITEYTMATVAVIGTALLYWAVLAHTAAHRRRILFAGVMVGAASIIGFLTFQLAFSRPELRPDANVSNSVRYMFQDPLELATLIPTRLWRAIGGAYAEEMGRWRFSWGEKSTLAAAMLGILCAAVIGWSARPAIIAGAKDQAQSNWRNVLLLFLLLTVSLLPELARQALVPFGLSQRQEDLSSRFMTQCLPFAACATVALLISITAARRIWVLPLLIGFLAGNTTFLHVYQRIRAESLVRNLGVVLRPYVEASPGIVVAITPDYYGREYEVIYKATLDWPGSLASRLWVMWENRGPTYFRHTLQRNGCEPVTRLDWNMQGILRQGPVSKMLWVEPRANGRQFSIEPYCVPAELPPARP